MTRAEQLQAEIKELEMQNGKRKIVIGTSVAVGATIGFLATRKASTTIKMITSAGSGLLLGLGVFMTTKKKAENRKAQIAEKKQSLTDAQKPLFNPSVIPAGPAPAPTPAPKAFPTDKGIDPTLNVDVNKNGIPDYLEPKSNVKNSMTGHPSMM
jgi:hypothetical protein